MKIAQFQVNPFCENVMVLHNPATHHCIIVDPGMMRQDERDGLTGFISDEQLEVQRVLITHCHIDHTASARWTADRYGVSIEASPLDAELAQALPAQAKRFGLKIEVQPLVPDHELHDGDELSLDDEPIKVLATPAHTPGGLTFYLPQSGIALVGDTIFRGSVGRTDLGGDMQALLHSVQQVILKLPAETLLVPGHGPATTVADELRHNPYAQMQ